MTAADSFPGGRAELAGRPVARIGFGAMQLEKGSDENASAVLRRAVELGVNHIDTAQFYGMGTANERIRAALHPYPDDLVLVSKVGADRVGDELVGAQRPEQLRASAEANLRTLGVERLDVVNLRRIDTGAGLRAAGDQVVDLDDQLAQLTALRDEGKIAAIGMSNVSADQVRAGLPVGLACVQNAYSLLDRSAEPLLELCRDNGLAWVPFFPLGSAFARFPKVTDEPAVLAAARSSGATPAQVGLAWLLAHDPGVLLIPGTGSVTHLEENVATRTVHLDQATTASLDGLGTA